MLDKPPPSDDVFWDLRNYMREPVAEIFRAAHFLDRAASAHLLQDSNKARELLISADIPEVREWTESLWGKKACNPDQWQYHRFREVTDPPPKLVKDERVPIRMPNRKEREEILRHWGFNCAFCGIPLIRKEVRKVFSTLYPAEAYWRSNANADQHAAFQCMWLQFDHILPHSRGGGNDVENVVITCAPCNFGRGDATLAEYGLHDPRKRMPLRSSWDGLERLVGDKGMSLT